MRLRQGLPTQANHFRQKCAKIYIPTKEGRSTSRQDKRPHNKSIQDKITQEDRVHSKKVMNGNAHNKSFPTLIFIGF